MVTLVIRLFIALMVVVPTESIAISGDITVELADAIADMPSGKYIDDLEEVSAECKAGRGSVKFTFSFGLVLGREDIVSCSYVKGVVVEGESSDSQYLFVKSRNVVVGYAVGEANRFIIEVGLPSKASVYLADAISEGITETANQFQSIDSEWVGIAVDFGLMEDNGSGFGGVVALRHLSASTNNLFGTEKRFRAPKTHFSVGGRYRFP